MKATNVKLSTATINAIGAWSGQTIKADKSKTKAIDALHADGVTADMLKADIKIEKEVAQAYDDAAKKVEDPDLKKLLLRIRDNEKYHIDIFNELLRKEKR